MYTDVRTPVFLQTARAIISNPDIPGRRMKVRMIFDGGSQWSYVTRAVKGKLGLSTEAIDCSHQDLW